MEKDSENDERNTPDQIWNHDITFHVELIRKTERSSSTYYEVYLPEKIRQLGLHAHDFVHITEESGDGIDFLKAVKVGPKSKAREFKEIQGLW